MEPDNVTYGNMTPLSPSYGSVSITGNFGPGSLSFGVDQDGKSVGSFTWGNDYVHIGSQPELDGWGWSIPFGIGSIGEEYTPTGRYGTLYVGHPNVGLTVSVKECLINAFGCAEMVA